MISQIQKFVWAIFCLEIYGRFLTTNGLYSSHFKAIGMTTLTGSIKHRHFYHDHLRFSENKKIRKPEISQKHFQKFFK